VEVIQLDDLPLRGERILLYFLVDMSGSMSSVLKTNTPNENQSRLDNVLQVVGNVADSFESHPLKTETDILALAFGVQKDDGVEDIIGNPVSISDWKDRQQHYVDHLNSFRQIAGGGTPMYAALKKAFHTMQSVTAKQQYGTVFLFLISDGKPTDSSLKKVLSYVTAMKYSGVRVVSCYLSSVDEILPKTLYGTLNSRWSNETKLMWTCASMIPSYAQVEGVLAEHGWKWEPNYRVFAQINHSQHLKDYVDTSLIISLLGSSRK